MGLRLLYTAGFLLRKCPYPHFTQIFMAFPLDQIPDVGIIGGSQDFELIKREIIFEVVLKRMWSQLSISQRHRRTDGRTTYRGITALCVVSKYKHPSIN